MRTFAHIINPVVVDPSSDLFVAQPVTFATMKTARDFATGQVAVELLSTQYPEDREWVPDGFTVAPDLKRSVLDLGPFAFKRKLPLVRDILDRLYEAAPEAEYLVFTNNDIALMPYFYVSVNALIDSGYDALVINRRAVSAEYRRLADIPLMYAATGRRHEGHDCFVFRREAFPRYALDDICVGMPFIGRVMVWNLFCFGREFKEFKAKHLTFHLGNPVMKWQMGGQADYVMHNKRAAGRVVQALESVCDVERVKAMLSAYPLEFNYGQYDMKAD
jgi:hypothetical protein